MSAHVDPPRRSPSPPPPASDKERSPSPPRTEESCPSPPLERSSPAPERSSPTPERSSPAPERTSPAPERPSSPPEHPSSPHERLSPRPELESKFYGPGNQLYRNYHPAMTGWPCNIDGVFIPSDTPPIPLTDETPGDWAPYRNRLEFETAEFIFTRNQMPASQIDTLIDLWGSSLIKHGDNPPFADHKDLYETIDNTPLGDVNWESFSVQFTGDKPVDDVAPWMDDNYDVWFRDPHKVVRNMLANPDYKDEMDYCPFREFSSNGDEHQYQDFMSGDWAWEQADIIARDPTTHGSTFVPVILGSDKTTVSVATGSNEYYPLYASIGNVRNNVRRAHRDALSLIGFLALPKTTKEHASTPEFRKFRRQLFHSSLARILERLKPAMTTPEVVRFGDGHYRRVIYGLGPYIADYEEQVLLACIVKNWCARCLSRREELDEDSMCRCEEHTEALLEESTLGILWDEYGIVGDLVPFTNDFPRADIHQLLAPDLLHQLIKGVFKDHLVDWVEKYLKHVHSTAEAERIMDDIDRRIAAVAPFSGLRRFPQGRGFKQWTGDDSKALMKVYLPAIEGHVPSEVVRTFRAFLEFCYLVRRNIITEETLNQIQDALDRFHCYREVFRHVGVVFTFSLPRQHSMKHYPVLIRLFGAPNGLCSSITECKHIKAVKQPWRRSSRYHALGQMLLTNQRLDKIAAARATFVSRGMLAGTCLADAYRAQKGNNTAAIPTQQHGDDDNDDSDVDHGPTQRKRPREVTSLAHKLSIPTLPDLIRAFLFEQIHPNDSRDPYNLPTVAFPVYEGKIMVFHSASSRFFAPSDLSGIGGMRKEHIRACSKWRQEHARYDCVFINSNPDLPGMRGLEIARVLCFFSFQYNGNYYPCAVVRWFDKVRNNPDEDTGMWMVRPALNSDQTPAISVIHVDAIYRAAHLIPIYGSEFIPRTLKFYHSYDAFRAYYVNKYADHHSFEIAF
ncbi:hypothetical protein BV22DRAFT_1103185 [Leucogyrophana mollusca]|uniref:Uncharacterized protein n=1 Tax=Leucogyrophana mollusca TaxID=85980 RepID=A0ACB8BSA4_9AGAM|nr:hypothetical protein BV22DRAFT_1103185 [Leucogyrophana mollusca]